MRMLRSSNVNLDAGTPFSGSSAVLSAYVRGIGSDDFAFNIVNAVALA
jgi:iron complex outermembrane recepter protein